MPLSFFLRPLDRSESSLSAALEVYRQCEDFLALGPVAVASREMVLADIHLSEKQGGVFYGIYAVADRALMGVVDYVLSGWEGDPAQAYLSLLMIAAPYRSQGLGEAVLHAVEDAIRRDGRAQALCAGVQVNNPRAIRFWQRMGFQIVSGPILYPDHTTAYNLWKPLF